MKKLEGAESELDNLARREKQNSDVISKLKQSLQREQQEKLKAEKELYEESKASNSVINNYFDNIQNMKIAFIGNLILSAILLVFIVIQNKPVFVECVQWFKDRAKNLYDFFIWIKDGLYMGTYKFIQEKFNPGEVGSNLLTILVIIVIAVGVFLLLKKLKDQWDIRSSHVIYYSDQGKPYIILKAVISFDIAVGILVACMTFYEPIKKLMPSFNILSIWILLTLIGLTIWNGKDWYKGFR